jgi:hypothetical protein
MEAVGTSGEQERHEGGDRIAARLDNRTTLPRHPIEPPGSGQRGPSAFPSSTRRANELPSIFQQNRPDTSDVETVFAPRIMV